VFFPFIRSTASKGGGNGCRHGRFAKGTALAKYTPSSRRGEERRGETGEQRQETSDLIPLV
jgi:hypothetical protein